MDTNVTVLKTNELWATNGVSTLTQPYWAHPEAGKFPAAAPQWCPNDWATVLQAKGEEKGKDSSASLRTRFKMGSWLLFPHPWSWAPQIIVSSTSQPRHWRSCDKSPGDMGLVTRCTDWQGQHCGEQLWQGTVIRVCLHDARMTALLLHKNPPS